MMARVKAHGVIGVTFNVAVLESLYRLCIKALLSIHLALESNAMLIIGELMKILENLWWTTIDRG